MQSGVLAITGILILSSCRSHSGLPALPEVSTASFLPAIRSEVDAAMKDARARPDDASAVGRLGMVLHAHQQVDSARQCYQRAALLAPKTFEWKYYLGVVSQGQAAVDALRAALKLHDALPVRLKLGEALLAVGDSAGAGEIYRGETHPAALFGYGRATNDPQFYEKALAAFPQYGEAMFALAQAYQRSGRSVEAGRLMAEYAKYKTQAPPVEDSWMDAVRALNRSPQQLLAQAIELEAHGQLGPAVEMEKKALELDPKLVQAHVNLISLYGRLGSHTEAEQHYRQAVSLNPASSEAYYNFGVLCYRSGRREEAKAAFTKAMEINPNHAETHNNLGSLLQEEGNIVAAAKEFERSIQLEPGLRLARFHLGRIYANQRRWPEAIEQLQRAIEVQDASTPTYAYALGATQARAGQPAAALHTLGKARDEAIAYGQADLAAAIERDLTRLRQ